MRTASRLGKGAASAEGGAIRVRAAWPYAGGHAATASWGSGAALTSGPHSSVTAGEEKPRKRKMCFLTLCKSPF